MTIPSDATLQGAGPAAHRGERERGEHAGAQQGEHDAAHGLVPGDGAHERKRVHEPADEARRPGDRECGQPREQPHRGACAARRRPISASAGVAAPM